MKRQDIINAILFFAEKYGQKPNYEAILGYTVLPSVVKMIVYELFTEGFEFHKCSEEEEKHYRVLLNYSLTLKLNGFVNFN